MRSVFTVLIAQLFPLFSLTLQKFTLARLEIFEASLVHFTLFCDNFADIWNFRLKLVGVHKRGIHWLICHLPYRHLRSLVPFNSRRSVIIQAISDCLRRLTILYLSNLGNFVGTCINIRSKYIVRLLWLRIFTQFLHSLLLCLEFLLHALVNGWVGRKFVFVDNSCEAIQWLSTILKVVVAWQQFGVIGVRLKTALLHHCLLLLSLQPFQLLLLAFSLSIESIGDGSVSCATEHCTAWRVTHHRFLQTLSPKVTFSESPRRVSFFGFRAELRSERACCSDFFNLTLGFLDLSLPQHLFPWLSQLTPPLFPTFLLGKRLAWGSISGQRVYFWLESTLLFKLVLRLSYEFSGSLPYFFIFSVRSNFISNCGLHKSGSLLLVSRLIVRLRHGFRVENLWIGEICSGLLNLLLPSCLIVISSFTFRFLLSNLSFKPFDFLFEHENVRVRVSVLIILHQRVIFILGVKRLWIEQVKLG